VTAAAGFISVVDHVVEHPHVWTERLSRAAWGDRIPHIARRSDGSDCWLIDGEASPLLGRGSIGAFAASPNSRPTRWEDVPEAAWRPAERLKALDSGGIAASVLYPTVAGLGGETFARLKDPALALACVQAYNDFLIDEWAAFSPRFVPQCVAPLGSADEAAAEIRRAAERGHRGVVAPPYPSKLGAHPHINDRSYDPIWRTCEELGVPICFHAGTLPELELTPYEGFSPAVRAACEGVTRPASMIFAVSNLLVSGILERFPKLTIVFADSGLGWLGFALEATQHQFDNFHLMEQDGYAATPLELFKRQCFATGHYGEASVRHVCELPGADNILWSANLPLDTSSWPETAAANDHSFRTVEPAMRGKILRDNAAALYGL
jgi:predicted TIM-barrel fold metal-dependent hydrolase